MAYERRIDRSNPGCILFLIDQSGSMTDPIGGASDSKANSVAQVVNSVLYELVLRCIKSAEEGPRHYYDVGVIGYGETVGPAFQLSGQESVLCASNDLGRNPISVADVTLDHGTTAKRPVWVNPYANGRTKMCGAMDLAGSTVAAWIAQHPNSFPPIVINITDGQSTDGDPTIWAERLKGLSTEDGAALLFNVNVSGAVGQAITFPATSGDLPDQYAEQLFQMSSELPAYMSGIAQAAGYPMEPGARGFAFNADFSTVASFLKVGTSTAQMDR